MMVKFVKSLPPSDQAPEDIFPLLRHSDTNAVFYFDESVGPIVTEVGSDSSQTKKCLLEAIVPQGRGRSIVRPSCC